MRQHRYRSLIRQLLPDHHVYVRSGPSSRYVVLSWPWQIGVSLAVVGVVIWASLASFGWVAAYLQTLEQRRELAQLAQALQLPGVATETALASARAGATLTPVALVVGLDEVKSGRRHASNPAELAAVETVDPRGEPATAEAATAIGSREDGRGHGWLAARLLPAAFPNQASSSGRDWIYDRLARHPLGDPARAAEMLRLHAELRAARAEIARLKSALAKGGSEADR